MIIYSRLRNKSQDKWLIVIRNNLLLNIISIVCELVVKLYNVYFLFQNSYNAY